jgi:GntR family transcriptional regulator
MTAQSDDNITALVAAIVLDRSSPVPLYFQAAQAMEAAITSGRVPPGTQLDNELLIASQLGLSRPTMRRAMQHLVDKGLIVRRRGVGTRVVQPKVRRSLELTSLYDDLARDGQAPTTRVLSQAVIPAPDIVAEALKLAGGVPVLCIERLRAAGGRPIAMMTNYVPEGLISPTVEQLEASGLYRLFRAASITMHSASQTIGARTATAQEARLLDEDKGAALLTMIRIAYDDHGSAVEYGTHIYAASRYTFDLSLMSA